MVAGSGAASAWGQVPAAERERQRIERLLQAVERQATLTFDRNGTRVDARDAVRFLRAKWALDSREVHTAEAFIERVGTRSSTTGRSYLVCDGARGCTESGPWLTALLRTLDGPRP